MCMLVDEPATFISTSCGSSRARPTASRPASSSTAPTNKKSVKVTLPSLNLAADAAADADGLAQCEMTAPNLALWSPGSPTLNDVDISAGDDDVKDRVGFRTIATQGKDILLNGKKVFCAGFASMRKIPARRTRLVGGRCQTAARLGQGTGL